MKKVLSFVLALALMLSAFSAISISAAEEVTGTIEGASLNIGSSLTLDYYATFSADEEKVSMRFTSSSGRITNVKGVYDEEKEMFKFSYTGINPQCMTDEISAELLYNNTVLAEKEAYNVKEYCDNQVTKSASELGYTDSLLILFRTLIADMLVYGRESQEYKSYKLDKLADASQWVSVNASEFTMPAGVREVSGNDDVNNRVVALGVNMSNVNRIYFKIKLTDDVSVELNGKAIEKSDLILNEDGVYVLYSEEIKATGFDNVYTLTLTEAGNVISTVKYNVNAYIVNKYADSEVGDIVKALSNYGASAEAYVKAITTDGDFDLEEEDDLLKEESKNLIPEKASTFEGATSASNAGWGYIGSPILSIVSDDYGSCMKVDPNGANYSSPMLNIAPYITEPGEYTVSFRYKVVGANTEGKSFSGIIRTDAENSFATAKSGQYYYSLTSSGIVEEGTWQTFTDIFYVEDEDIASPNNVGAPWRLGLHVIEVSTVKEIYIDDVTLVKTEIKHVTKAETWVAEEITLPSDKFYDDPFNDVEIDLILTNGTVTYKIPGFWDGGNIWRIRFVCTEPGNWTYTTECNDTTNSSLHNISGSLRCMEYSGDLDIYKHGFVRTEENKSYFVYDDGTPFFYLGDTHWGLGTETQDMVETISSLRAEQGYTVYQSQPIGAGFKLENGMTKDDIMGFKSMDKKFQYIASVGLVHANSQFIFPSKMSALIANNGGYSTNLLGSAQKYKTGSAANGDNVDENGYLLDEKGNKIKYTANLYELSSEAKAYLEKLSRYWVARYSAYPVMWTLGQEVDRDFFWTQTNDAHGHSDWGMANNPYKEIANYLYEHDPYKHPLSAHQEGSTYTDSSNSAFRGMDAHTWWATQWKPSLINESLHTKAKTFAEYSEGKPLINYEPYYVYLQTKNFGGRAQAWMSFLSGFAGHAYGAQDTWCYTNEYVEDEVSSDKVDTITPEEKQAATWKSALEYPVSFQMIYMKNFLTGTMGQWYSLIPRYDDTKYLVRDEGALAVIASTSDHRKIVIYFYNFENTEDVVVGETPNAEGHGTATGTLKKLSKNTEYNYMWFNPITGVKSYGSFTSTAQGTWDIPDKAMQDMVLYVYNR